MQSKYWFSALSGLMLMWTATGIQAEPLKSDPAWQQGKLDNGFKWQILATPHRPSDKIEVRLEINVGSLQESMRQVGFSYLLPRLATINTENFDSDRVDALLSQITVENESKPLVDVSYDYTRYNLSLPNNKPELLKEALIWLSEAVKLPTVSDAQVKEIDQQKASPLIMLPNGISDGWWRYRIKNSPLVGHEPSQSTSSEMTVEQLGEFYHKWYTPDAMTLYVVGNVDRRMIIDQINKSFGSLEGKRTTPATIAALAALPPTPVNFLSENVDKNNLKLVWDDPWHPVVTTASLERQWLSMIANDMIKKRLLQKQSRSSLKSATIGLDCQMKYQRYTCELSMDAPLSAVKPGLKFIATELSKLDKDGITEAELNALVAEQKEELAQAIATYAKTDTAQIMEYRLIVEKSGSVAVSPEAYQELRQKFLDNLDLMSINTRIHQLLTIKPTLVLTQPAGEAEENVKALSDLFDSIMTPPVKK